jgi:hypothetical protein
MECIDKFYQSISTSNFFKTLTAVLQLLEPQEQTDRHDEAGKYIAANFDR